MKPLVSPDEMAGLDRAAIDRGTSASTLMARAGSAVARTAIRVAGGRYRKRAAVVCGKGNNGGDGFVAARILVSEGLGVRCLAVGDMTSSTGAAADHLRRLRRFGNHPRPFDEAALSSADVIVDAIFGTGFSGRAEGEPAAAIESINSSGVPIVAVDIPSGVNGATGQAEGPAVSASVTVAMAAQKIGTAVGEGATRAGEVEVVDIGIDVSGARAWLTEEADVRGVLPHRPLDAHKRSGGAVAILAGSDGMTGAAVLAGRGAVRSGAGYATVGATRTVDSVVATTLPEVLSRVVTDSEFLGPEAVDAFAEVLERADSIAIGPGLGEGDRQRELVRRVVAELELPVVLDADGLNVLAGHTEWLSGRDAPLVMTPHPGELSRLLGKSTGDIQADRVASATAAAERFGCVVLLKGHRTVVAEPSGRAVVNPLGGPELATAGTGDVLTGVVAALLAAGLEPFEAAWAAAYVHGRAGERAAHSLGVGGVLAWDVAESLPHAISEMSD